MRFIYLTILTSFFLVNQCASQPDSTGRIPVKPHTERAIKLLVGGSLQEAGSTASAARKYFEVGIHKTKTIYTPIHPAAAITHGLSVEVSPSNKTIYGFKYGTWGELWLFVAGINGIYYTDFDHGSFKIRPELGFGAYPFKLTVGYNIPTINNRDFKEIQNARFQVSLNVLLKLKTLRKVRQE